MPKVDPTPPPAPRCCNKHVYFASALTALALLAFFAIRATARLLEEETESILG